MEHAFTASVGEELTAITEESARGHFVNDANETAAAAFFADGGVLHLEHLAAAAAELFDHDAGVFVGDVDHDLFVGFEGFAVFAFAGDDARAGDGELVALTPHGLHENAEVQLAAAGHGHRVGRVRVLDAQRDVALELLVKSIAQLPAGDVLPIASGKRGVVDDEVHREGRLFDGDAGEPLGPQRIRDGGADLDAFDTRQRDDLAGRRLLDLLALEALEPVEPRDPALAIAFQRRKA